MKLSAILTLIFTLSGMGCGVGFFYTGNKVLKYLFFGFGGCMAVASVVYMLGY